MSPGALLRVWLWVSALASVGGWVLSALGALNARGYVAFIVAGIAALWAARHRLDLTPAFQSGAWRKVLRRFRRPLPCSFAVLAGLILLGGCLYAPNNHTALTYRIPRVLHWLAEGQWHWIHTPGCRMNNRACGIEWLTAPLLLFTKSDRGLFLLNLIPFLFLPGLVFSLCRRLGVRSAVAWQWMWLLPTGYNFLLQAGSAANDTFPAVYALAAVDFACRAWVSRRPSDLLHSMLAAALLTGAKASNLPLLLPWIIPFVAGMPMLKRAPGLTVSVCAVAALVSFLPTAALNVRFCGDWSGLKLERVGMDMKNPFVGVWGNGLIFLLNNFAPPFFPQAGWWNHSALEFLPRALAGPLVANFEDGFHLLGEMPTEDWAGLGLGVSLLLAICGVAAGAVRRSERDAAGTGMLPPKLRLCVLVAPWFALLAYSMKSGMVTGARLISPYYPLLLPLLVLGPGPALIVRSRWWRWLVGATLLVALILLVIAPARPLWPARTVVSKLSEKHPGSRALSRALSVYTIYASRSDSLREFREKLPRDLAVVGFLGTEDDIDMSLWRPFFERRVEHVLLSDSPESIRQRRLEYVVVSEFQLTANNVALTEWLERNGAELLWSASISQKVAAGPQSWHLVRLK